MVRRWSVRASRVVAGAAAVAVAGTVLGGATAWAGRPAQRPRPGRLLATHPDALARWAPSYTLSPDLPDFDAATTLTAQDGTLWLASEGFVSRFRDGAWSPPEVPPDLGAMFALAAVGDEAWAFGFEGGSWHRSEGAWRALPRVTGADLYDAVALARNDVWAVGFDYGSEFGTLVRDDGVSLSATVHDWLFREQLFAVAAAPDGTLWAGGCDYAYHTFLMRRPPGGDWAPETAPAAGCVRDLSFAKDGAGLAAAATDVLVWDGSGWHGANLSPPQGLSWVRVAATAPSDEPATATLQLTGWALPALPQWPTYTGAEAPWYFDGDAWAAATADYRGLDAIFEPSEANPHVRPFASVVSDGVRGWAVTRVAGTENVPATRMPDGSTGLLLLDHGEVSLAHPLLTEVEDLAVAGGSELWAAGLGTPGLLLRGDSWVAPALGDTPYAGRLDFAAEDLGWSLAASPSAPMTATLDTTLFWNGQTWLAEREPGDRSIRDIRALPDGRVWGASDAAGLVERDIGTSWRPVLRAPALGVRAPGAAPGAPFDVVREAGRLVGWVGAADGFYRYEAGAFQAVGARERHAVTELQLSDSRHGWALAYPLDGGGPVRRFRQLLRLTDNTWAAVPIDPALLSVDWVQMATVSADEVWLLGNARIADSGGVAPILARYDGAWALFGDGADGERAPTCSASRLAVTPRDDGSVDVWLGGARAPCGPVTGAPATDALAGPVSVLSVSPVRGSVWLPTVQR